MTSDAAVVYAGDHARVRMNFGSGDNLTAQISIIAKDATGPTHPDVSIEVDDLDAVHDRAIASGAEIVYAPTIEPWGVRRFFVRDPNGAVINILTHVAKN
jgi:uncharacterized glyoxalase superfamily protein PhnB